jgi:Gpi18-like mannosyltransferase
VFFLTASLLKKDQNRFEKASLAGAITLYLPTIFLNSAIWGQADSIYTAFIIWSLFLYTKNRPIWGMVFYGIAFAFKLQAIFVLPLFIIVYLLNRPKQLWHFLLIPALYLVFCIPPLIAGRPLIDLLKIYVNQTNTYQRLTLNMPNMYQWFPGDEYRYQLLSEYGFALFAVLMAVAFFYLVIKKLRLHLENIVDIALWSVLMANFFLPAMHERYLYIADSLSLVYYLTKKRHMWVPLTVNLISLLAYFPFLFGLEPIDHSYVAIGYAIVLVLITRQVFKDVEQSTNLVQSNLA